MNKIKVIENIINLADPVEGGLSPPMNVISISLVLRGEMHTYRKMALRR